MLLTAGLMPGTTGKTAGTDDIDNDACSIDEDASDAYCVSSCMITSDTIATFHTYFSFWEVTINVSINLILVISTAQTGIGMFPVSYAHTEREEIAVPSRMPPTFIQVWGGTIRRWLWF